MASISRESSSAARGFKYDVFLSFRGADTRKGITSDLYHRLQARGIKTFMDDSDLQVGDVISPALLKAIEESRFAIIVLSQNYAFSTWCVEELTKICECMEDQSRILPLFYGVEPSDVRYRNRSFGEAFTKHESSGRHTSDKVQQWRDALSKVATFPGWTTLNYKTERELVEAIVEFVRSKLVHDASESTGDFEAYEATRKAMDEVMKALKDDEVTAVGVYGMGGVGKTSMVRHVAAQACKNGTSNHWIMAAISQSPDNRKVQGTLADLLGIKLMEETEDGRAARLLNEIRRREKLLIILDDVWSRTELSTIGIPIYKELQKCRSKVLLITRRRNVCHVMECQAIIPLNILSEQDSWTLFVRNAGVAKKKILESTTFEDVARRVAGECRGLPIALTAVARALRDKDEAEWQKAAQRLEKSQSATVEDEEDAFKCIKSSYDYLKSEDSKSFFLLCCLYPEGHDIPVENLFKDAIAKGLFRDAETIEEARGIADSVVNYLKNSSLLLDSEKNGCVKMHDVIRDTALNIAKSEYGFLVTTKEIEPTISRETAASLPSSLESSSSASRWKYDVFLSFRGPDTSKGITSDLCHRLQGRGIKTFMDDRDLEVGDAVSPTLLKTIEESRFAIVVLSRNYASSTWCLEELVKICECMEDQSRILPLFYDVEPSDVQYQKKSFEEAFSKHETSGRHPLQKVQLWRYALNKVATFSGWNMQNYNTVRELVESIVELLSSKVVPDEIESTGDFEAFEATRQAMDDVMKALKDDQITAVGVYGMGGVGKTSMVKHVAAQACKNGTFNHWIMAAISQSPDLRKIQGTLADLLGFRFEEETEGGRADRLHKEVMRREKLLIILDDVQDRPELSSIGIPSYKQLQTCNSKVILTTRGSHVCYVMNCQASIRLSILSEQDSWTLFVRNAGVAKKKILESTTFEDVARRVAGQCGGLPIALTAVARALRDKDEAEWQKAAQRLEKSLSATVKAEENASECIKFSFDYLKDEHSKSCFLLCCLYPEDHDIPVENLFKYAIRKGLFRDAKTIEEARGTADSVVKYLKDSSLLLDSEKNGCVKMHDVIRDTALDIAKSVYGLWVTPTEIEPTMSQETAASLPSSAEPSPAARRWEYDVFLSYRGGDTPMNFIPDFYDGLQKRGIKTFMYDRDTIEYAHYPIFRAIIEESRHAILVLTEKYACSSQSLEELTIICECMKDKNRILPVFYNVKPSDIQYRKRSFGEAFDKHESSGRHTSGKVKRWKDVLNHVASLSGWHTKLYKTDRELVDTKLYKTDRELVDDIVDFVCSKIHHIEIELTMSTGDFEAFESTRRAMNGVMKALRDDGVTAVGVYGKGGVGKTTMVEHVSEVVKNNGMFHHVITVVVSKSPDLRKIQGILADLLGVELEEETEIGRSHRLMQKIRRGNRILIILDDIWERIDLSNIGIPSFHELQRCNSKVLLTTRTHNVCCAMDCQSNIYLDVLSEEDSWTLFVNKAKMSFESIDVAREVARECAGLPVALIAVAKALGDKCLDDWEEAARRLRASQTANPEDGKIVFNCIKLSYDYLKSDDYRSCFLLCCLFPEDYDIQIEDLLNHGMDLQDSSTMRLHDARASAYLVVKYLKDCSLLLKSEQDGCVKMHDVIRDVAILIAEDDPLFLVKAGCQLKEWPNMGAQEGYSAISVIRNKICKLPEELVCPNLLILFMQSNVYLDEIPKYFFLGLNELRVLDLSRTRISLLPTSFNLLMNLHTLYLDGCLSIINNISALGNLKKLKILSMRDLPLVELPKEIGHLSNLRMLDITGEYVDIVPSELICNLHRLEELYMQCNFADWRSKVGRNEVNESEVEEAGEENIAAFDELTSLSDLNILKVFISDAKCLPEDVEVEPNWINFDICISRNPSIRKVSLVSSSSPTYTRALTLGTTINALPSWFINTVTRKAEKLQYIMCSGLDNILVEYDHERLHALKYLSVIGPNEKLKVLMNTKTWVQNEPVFQNLEELHLIQVDSLKELCVGELPLGSLCNLRLLKVKHCYELLDALLSSQLLQRIRNLEKLICEEMDELEYVFGCEGLKPEDIILTELKEMRLENLGRLIKVWNGPAPCAIFQNLRSLVVSGCFELENLFTADVARCLLQLKDLSVELCPLLDRVIEASKETIDSKIVLTKLKNLALIKLPQLTRFYGNTGNAIECPVLEYLYVERCPQFSTSDFHSRNKVQLNHQ